MFRPPLTHPQRHFSRSSTTNELQSPWGRCSLPKPQSILLSRLRAGREGVFSATNSEGTQKFNKFQKSKKERPCVGARRGGTAPENVNTAGSLRFWPPPCFGDSSSGAPGGSFRRNTASGKLLNPCSSGNPNSRTWLPRQGLIKVSEAWGLADRQARRTLEDESGEAKGSGGLGNLPTIRQKSGASSMPENRFGKWPDRGEDGEFSVFGRCRRGVGTRSSTHLRYFRYVK